MMTPLSWNGIGGFPTFEGARRVSAMAITRERDPVSSLSTARSADLSLSAQVTPCVVWTDRTECVASLGECLNSAGDCVSPVPIQLMSNEYGSLAARQVGRWQLSESMDGLYTCNMSVRCRKCPECRQWSARQWMARAIAECEKVSRTWFATLTFDWRHKPGDQSFQWRYARRELTLWFKRLRKKGLKFRYLAVFEAHRDGRPHIHLLLHETSPATYRRLTSEWRAGFSKIRLVKGSPVEAARYCTKYIFKDHESGLCRVRASLRYGQRSDTRMSDCTASDVVERVAPDRSSFQTCSDTPLPLNHLWFSLWNHRQRTDL